MSLCRHVCRQHLSCVHPALVSPSSLSIAGHAPLGWTCRRRSGRPSSGPPRPPGSIRIRSVSSPAAVLRGRRPRARWARSAASLSCSVRKHFAICSCGGISQICQWYRVCDAGALRAEPLATLLSCAVKNEITYIHCKTIFRMHTEFDTGTKRGTAGDGPLKGAVDWREKWERQVCSLGP